MRAAIAAPIITLASTFEFTAGAAMLTTCGGYAQIAAASDGVAKRSNRPYAAHWLGAPTVELWYLQKETRGSGRVSRGLRRDGEAAMSETRNRSDSGCRRCRLRPPR